MSLVCEAVRFSYGSRAGDVLRGVDAAFESGGVTVVLGPNGAGKSTLLRLLAGVRRPSGGRITIDGVELGRLRARERATRLAYVAQRPIVAQAFTVREVVALGVTARGGNVRSPIVADAIERTGCAPIADRVFNELSAGQQQRAAIARAIAQLGVFSGGSNETGPRYLLADEPVSALDPAWIGQTVSLLQDAAGANREPERDNQAGRSGGVGVVMVLHDVALAGRVAGEAGRAVLLGADGRVAAAGRASDVLRRDRLESVYGGRFDEASVGGRTVLLPAIGNGRGDAN